MSEIITQTNNLPSTLEGLTRFTLICREKLNAVQAEIRAIDKLGLATEVREQKLQEAQKIGNALLDAETEMGKLMLQLKKCSGRNSGNQHEAKKEKTKNEKIKELGLNEKLVTEFELMARYPEVVEQAKAEARENNEIATRNFILEKIREYELKSIYESVIEEQTDKKFCDWKTSVIRDIITNPKKNDTDIPCEVCYRHHPITELHHIVSVKELTKLLNMNVITLAEVSTPVVWLCPNCHSYLHKIMSRKGDPVKLLDIMHKDGYTQEEIDNLMQILRTKEDWFHKLMKEKNL